MIRPRRSALVTVVVAAVLTALLVPGRLAAVDPPAPGAAGRPAFPFPPELESRASRGKGPGYSGYVPLVDDDEALTTQVPKEWTDIDTGRWVHNGQDVGIFIAASRDLERFNNKQSEPGVYFAASRTLARSADIETLLEQTAVDLAKRCMKRDRIDYQDLFYGGSYDYYIDCSSGSPNVLQMVVMPPSRDLVIVVRIVAVNRADLDAAANIFRTFQVVGPLDGSDAHDHE